jgi:hypothetical protein
MSHLAATPRMESRPTDVRQLLRAACGYDLSGRSGGCARICPCACGVLRGTAFPEQAPVGLRLDSGPAPLISGGQGGRGAARLATPAVATGEVEWTRFDEIRALLAGLRKDASRATNEAVVSAGVPGMSYSHCTDLGSIAIA